MRGNTAFADAFERSGYDAQGVLRRQTAYELLRLCDGSINLAVSELKSAKADMEAKSLRGGGQIGFDDHAECAASPLPNGEAGGQSDDDNHTSRASSSPPHSGCAGHDPRDNQMRFASRSLSNGARADQTPIITEAENAPLRQHIQRPRSEADIKAAISVEKASARTLLTTMTTADGTLWGEICFYELDSMDRDGAIARSVKALYGSRIAQVNELRGKRLKELLTPDEFRLAVDHAREMDNG